MGSTLIFLFFYINVLKYHYFYTDYSTYFKIKNVGKREKYKTSINVYYNYGVECSYESVHCSRRRVLCTFPIGYTATWTFDFHHLFIMDTYCYLSATPATTACVLLDPLDFPISDITFKCVLCTRWLASVCDVHRGPALCLQGDLWPTWTSA